MTCPTCDFRFLQADWPERCPRCRTLRPFAAARVAQEEKKINRQLDKRRIK